MLSSSVRTFIFSECAGDELDPQVGPTIGFVVCDLFELPIGDCNDEILVDVQAPGTEAHSWQRLLSCSKTNQTAAA